MKNKLAENMIRFGVKNLTESNIERLTEDTGPIRMQVNGRKNKQPLGDFHFTGKTQIPYDTQFVKDSSGTILNPKVKHSNITYRLRIYDKVLTQDFPGFSNGGTIFLDKLEFVAPGGAGTSLDWKDPIELNQQIPLSNGNITTTQFEIPIPAPNAVAWINDRNNKVDLKFEDEKNGRTLGIDGGRYTLRGRIQSPTMTLDQLTANVDNAVADGRRTAAQGKAAIEKFNANNPSGTGQPATSGEFYIQINVSLNRVATPVAPSQTPK